MARTDDSVHAGTPVREYVERISAHLPDAVPSSVLPSAGPVSVAVSLTGPLCYHLYSRAASAPLTARPVTVWMRRRRLIVKAGRVRRAVEQLRKGRLFENRIEVELFERRRVSRFHGGSEVFRTTPSHSACCRCEEKSVGFSEGDARRKDHSTGSTVASPQWGQCS